MCCPCKRSRYEVRGQSKFCPNWGVSGLLPEFQSNDSYEMMHKAWSSIEKVPYCFQGHPSIPRWHKQDKKSNRIGRFRAVNPVWICRWLWNDEQSIEKVPYNFWRSSMKFQSHTGQKIDWMITEVICPVIGRAQSELTPSMRQKTGPGITYAYFTISFNH